LIEWIAQENAKKTLDIGMTIPEGIMFVYKFNANGTVSVSNQKITPYPYASESENQLYADSFAAIVSGDTAFPKNSDEIPLLKKKGGKGIITLTNNWDIYIRDECRTPGDINGGKHAGEPMTNSLVAIAPTNDAKVLAWRDNAGSGSGAGPATLLLGSGNIPLLSDQGGWNLDMEPYEPDGGFGSIFTTYPLGPSTGGVRPTYQTNGTAFDIRFRRQVHLGDASKELGFGTGYVADELLP
jgi:hypothetical protein